MTNTAIPIDGKLLIKNCKWDIILAEKFERKEAFMKDGFLKIAAATPEIKVADCVNNGKNITALAVEAASRGVKLAVFPELSITAYTCGDLFLSTALLDEAELALLKLAEDTAKLDMVLAVGLPLRCGASLFNVAAIICQGKILGFVPKQNIPNYSEFYEIRHFTAGKPVKMLDFHGNQVPLGTNLLFTCETLKDFVLGVEICEDVWVTTPPSCGLAEAGATVIINLSASDEIIGKSSYRRNLVLSQSGRTVSAYVYADAGQGESTTDLIFASHNLIAENGTLLAESPRFKTGLTVADIDLGRLSHDRRRMNTFKAKENDMITVPFMLEMTDTKLERQFPMKPFVPSDTRDLTERCEEILTLQATGLATRLKHTKSKTAVVGLSGGLDSALALIVTVHAFDMLGLDRKGILAITMPCFGTTSRTKNNALALAEAYGTSIDDINITNSVVQHFKDIGQPMDTHDVTFENGQARERTQVLMDIANQRGGMVVGTGDLSELALGWATYNGDHMSMYAVNASIPKTLVRHLTAYEAQRAEGNLKEVLLDVLDTPVSPELLPPKDGKISQKTEELVGPYELHDFYLYYFLRFGFRPKKIFRMAKHAFNGVYDDETIKKWLCVFLKRFFVQQFKRSCLPDGPKVGSITLSPRGDWRMPSDASAEIWLREADSL